MQGVLFTPLTLLDSSADQLFTQEMLIPSFAPILLTFPTHTWPKERCLQTANIPLGTPPPRSAGHCKVRMRNMSGDLTVSPNGCCRQVLCPHFAVSQDQASSCFTRARLLRLSKRKITTAQPFPTGNDYAFVATEGAPWQAAQAPQVMAATGGATETLAFRGRGEKGENALSESPTQTAQGKPICQSGK